MIQQNEMFEIKSPCKRICTTNSRGYCKGCFRNRNERFYWQDMSIQQKRHVIELCKLRRLRVLARKDDEAFAEYPDISSNQVDLFDQPEPNPSETTQPKQPSTEAKAAASSPTERQEPPRRINEEQLDLF